MAHDSAETTSLLDRIAQGDREAFEELFLLHRAELRRAIELRLDRRLRARLDASDVVQETQFEAFRRIEDYLRRRPMPFVLWLRKTAHERLAKLRAEHLGVARRSVDRESPMPEHSAVRLMRRLGASSASPSRQAMNHERIARVRGALAQLSERDREILLMRYVEKLSNAEIGCLLDLTPAAVSKRHGRALLRLQTLLSDENDHFEA